MSIQKQNKSHNNCIAEPDFAEICAFLQKFSGYLRIVKPRFRHLHQWLENTDEFPEGLQIFIIRLFKSGRNKVPVRQLKQHLIKFCLTYSAEDAEALRNSSDFHMLSLQQKIRCVKELLDSLFVKNRKLRKYSAKALGSNLRKQPLGYDHFGCHYVLETNPEFTICKQSKTMHLTPIATTRAQVLNLISKINANKRSRSSWDSGIDDDSNTSPTSLLNENEENLIIFLETLNASFFK